MAYGVALALAVGLGLPIAVLAAATAQGRAAASGMESIARQPESFGDIRQALLISLAFIESLVIYALLMFFLLMGRLPPVLDVVAQ
ncbi:MAG: ATP synthase F0 subunit C [Armatimonadota bacterium]